MYLLIVGDILEYISWLSITGCWILLACDMLLLGFASLGTPVGGPLGVRVSPSQLPEGK